MRVFSTDNVDLAAFLMLQEIPFLECSKVDGDVRQKPKAVMIFDDSKQNCRDLERVFLTSPEKKYRDLTKYCLKQVHMAINEPRNVPLKEASR